MELGGARDGTHIGPEVAQLMNRHGREIVGLCHSNPHHSSRCISHDDNYIVGSGYCR